MFENLCLLIDYVYAFFTALGEVSMLTYEDLVAWLWGSDLLNISAPGLFGNSFQLSIGSLDFFDHLGFDITIGDVPLSYNFSFYFKAFIIGIFEFLFDTPLFPTSVPFFILSIIAIFRIFIFVVMWDFAWKIINVLLKLIDVVLPF